MSTDQRAVNLFRLKALVRSHRARGRKQYAVLDAVREFTGCSISALCRTWGLDRTSVQLCLRRAKGRDYTGTRRELELRLQLPTYALDYFLDGTPLPQRNEPAE